MDIISERDEEGTRDAREKIGRFSRILIAVVRRGLEELYQEDEEAWWFQGVPTEVQSFCQQAVTKDKGKSAPWDHVGLEHAVQIMQKSGNWRYFKNVINARANRGSKKDQVLLDITNIIPISEILEEADAALSRTQVAMIEDFSTLITDMASEVGLNEASADVWSDVAAQ